MNPTKSNAILARLQSVFRWIVGSFPFLKTKTRLKHVIIKQHDLTDCGATCLASIAAYYELTIPVARIRQYASTDKKGTNVLGLLEAAN
ncbi:MAG TPA: cysteine peptidase family C39 domain-containing protein, partial [Dyadobacter sp.]|nr:cysteine peptidase family C39 domain-containing protein [Dyadobacter sp.]